MRASIEPARAMRMTRRLLTLLAVLASCLIQAVQLRSADDAEQGDVEESRALPEGDPQRGCNLSRGSPRYGQFAAHKRRGRSRHSLVCCVRAHHTTFCRNTDAVCSMCAPPRILDVQVFLLAVLANKPTKFTIYDYGFPSNGAVEQEVYDKHLPSIKKSHASILATSPKKGPNMHDTPPSQES